MRRNVSRLLLEAIGGEGPKALSTKKGQGISQRDKGAGRETIGGGSRGGGNLLKKPLLWRS